MKSHVAAQIHRSICNNHCPLPFKCSDFDNDADFCERAESSCPEGKWKGNPEAKAATIVMRKKNCDTCQPIKVQGTQIIE